MINFFNIPKQDKLVEKKIINSFKKNIKNSNFILGKEVKSFENKFSNFTNSKYSVSCANGTDSIYLALKSLNLPANSEVIVPAMTWISTALSVVNCGLKPVLVDIEKNSPLISLSEILKKITPKTKVIIPVHLYGSIFFTKKLREKINKKIFIIEDSAQAHGGKYEDGKKIGKYSDMTCYSFYPGKNLGCYGDGGLITTNNQILYRKLIKLRNLGSYSKYKFDLIGINSRLDAIQASILKIKIKRLNFMNLKRKIISKIYNKEINNKNFLKLNYSKFAVFHQYVILTKKRNKLIKLLKKNNIEYGLHYPISLNNIKCFNKYFKNQKYYYAEKLAKCCISLPIDPLLKLSSVKKICKVLNKF